MTGLLTRHGTHDMNLLKSMFISVYMMLAMALAAYAGWRASLGANVLGWVGVLATTVPILMLIGWLMMFKSSARTSAHLPTLNLMGLAGVGLAAWTWAGQSAQPGTLGWAVLGWIGFLVYAYWYSSFGRTPSEILRVGRQLPTFAIRDASGAVVSSIQLRGKPTVFVFYRGNWCPLCMAQVKELAARYRDLDSLGVRVALVSPQPHSNTVSLARRMNVSFDFYTDEGNMAGRALGIDNPHGLPMGMQMLGYDSETVLPTVVIVDRNGQVLWVHETDNYRVRPEPDVYLEVLLRHGAV